MTCYPLPAFNRGGTSDHPLSPALCFLCNPGLFFSVCLFIWSYTCSDLLIKRFLRIHIHCFSQIRSLPWRLSKIQNKIQKFVWGIAAKIQVTWNYGLGKRPINMPLSHFWAFMALSFSFWVWNWEQPLEFEEREEPSIPLISSKIPHSHLGRQDGSRYWWTAAPWEEASVDTQGQGLSSPAGRGTSSPSGKENPSQSTHMGLSKSIWPQVSTSYFK